MKEVGLGRQGQTFGGGIDDALEVQSDPVVGKGGGEVGDALRVGALEGIGDPQKSGELGHAEAIFGAELPVIRVGKLRGVLTVVAGHEGHEEAVGVAEPKDLGVPDDVKSMQFVGLGRDVVADLVEDCGDLEE